MSNNDTNLDEFKDLAPDDVVEKKRATRLTKMDKRLAAQMYSLGVSQRKIAIALNRDVRTIYKQIKSLDLIRGGAPDAIRQRVSAFMDLLDPVAAVTHANCMVSGDVDIKSKHSLAHLKGKQYLTEQTTNIITQVSDDQVNKSLFEALCRGLTAKAEDTVYSIPTHMQTVAHTQSVRSDDSCTEIVQPSDSMQGVAHIEQRTNSDQTAPKKKRRKRGRYMHRAKDYPRGRKQATNNSLANATPNDLRGDPTSVAGEARYIPSLKNPENPSGDTTP